MNSQYQGQMRPQVPSVPPYQQNVANTFDMQGRPVPMKGYNPGQYANAGIQNGHPNAIPGRNQSNPQVQSAAVPPNSHIINNQMAQDFNAMHLSQNHNQPLLTNNQRTTSQAPPPTSMPNQQQYWQPQPRASPLPASQFQNNPSAYPQNANYPTPYSAESVPHPNNNAFVSNIQQPYPPQHGPQSQQGDRTYPPGPPLQSGFAPGPSSDQFAKVGQPPHPSNHMLPPGQPGDRTFTPVPPPGERTFTPVSHGEQFPPPGHQNEQSFPPRPPSNQVGPLGHQSDRSFPLGPQSNQFGQPGVQNDRSFPPGPLTNQVGPPGYQNERILQPGPPSNQVGHQNERGFQPVPPVSQIGHQNEHTFQPIPPGNQVGQQTDHTFQQGLPSNLIGPPVNHLNHQNERTFQPGPPSNQLRPPGNQIGHQNERTFPPGPPVNQPGPPRRPGELTYPPGDRSYPPGHPGDRPIPPVQPNRMPENYGQQPLSVYTNGTRGASPAGQYPPPMNSNLPGQYPQESPVPGQLPPASQYGQPPAGMQSQNRPNQPAPMRRLDPDNMPSPIQVIEDDRKLRSCTFNTSQRGLVPPLVTTNFTVVDEGICSPRFIRSTIYNVPTTAEMLKQTYVPFAMAISPFAHLHEDERPPPIVDPGAEGPVRCHRCRAYMSPYMQFIDAGRRFQCTLCKTATEVPAHYFTHLDHMGQRVDKLERAELCLGSYEFIVNKDYCKEGKFPNCPAFIFLIDVSYNGIRSGMVQTICDNMKSVLEKLPRESGVEESKMRVGFVTYSTAIHFYNINKNLAQPQMLVVSDVHDMFMPLLDGFLVHPSEAGHVIDSLMAQIPAMFADTRETETVLGPAIQAGMEALKAAECAGKLFVFHSTLPIAEAPGKLKSRDDRKLLGTDKEKTILAPQTTFYNNLGQECVKCGCAVDVFLFNNAYIDIATLGQVCRLTGGQLFKYTYFQADIDGERFIEDLRRDIEKPIAFDAVLRVRTSTGIRPTEFTGSFFMSNTTDVELACVTGDQSLTVEIKYDDKLTEEEGVVVQCAVLYTSCSGQRRLRVHNLALNTCSQMAELFRNCELDAILNVFLKEGVRRVTEENPRQIRESLVSRAAQILACYRKNCAQASSAGQLILPECMKLLPLYINCLIKCDALSGAQEISTDDRSFIMLASLNMDVDSSAAYLYPRLIPMHEITPQPDYVQVPTALRCSFERLKENGVYLIENGLSLFLWIGMNAESQWVQDVFGVPAAARIDVERNKLLQLDTALSECVHLILSQVQSERQRHMKLYLVRQGEKTELLFRQLLVEDRTTEGSASYVDFLCHLHKEIRSLLS